MRTTLLVLILAFHLARAVADGPVKPVNTDAHGVALHGYDVVAYFTASKPVEGVSRFEHQWNGATWRFASETNRDLFANAPEAYAPQFGGYCAWAVSRNYTADIDPEAFDVVGGRLYLNYSKLVQLRWKMNRAGDIAKGEQNWRKLVHAAKGTK